MILNVPALPLRQLRIMAYGVQSYGKKVCAPRKKRKIFIIRWLSSDGDSGEMSLFTHKM